MQGLDAGAIIAVITALASLGVALSSRRKNDADAAAAVTEATMSLLDPLNRRVSVLEDQVGRLRRGIRRLCTQIRELGDEPCWQPEDDDDGDA